MSRAVSPHAVTPPARSGGPLVVFRLDDQRYALRLDAVERILRSVEIVPLPRAPDIVTGVINVRGRLLPVVDVRRRFRLPPRELGLDDHFIVARTDRRAVVLVADAVLGVLEHEDGKIVAQAAIAPQLGYIEGAVKLDDGVILIHDLDTFLSSGEDQQLESSLNGARQ